MPFQIFPNVTFYWLLSHILWGCQTNFWTDLAFCDHFFIKITQIASLPDYTTWLFQRRNQVGENWGNCPWPTFAGGAPSAVFRKQISNPHLNSKTPRKNKSPTEILFTAEILVFYCRNTCLFSANTQIPPKTRSMWIGQTLQVRVERKRMFLTQGKLLSRVWWEGEAKNSHGGDEHARNYQVEEVVQGSSTQLDDEGYVQVRLRTALVDHFVSLCRHSWTVLT